MKLRNRDVGSSSSSKVVKRKKWKPQGPINIGQLPKDLVIDILLRLPIRTLGDARFVCKQWLSIISDPKFAHLHRLRSPMGILIQTIQPIKQNRALEFVNVQNFSSSRLQVSDRLRFAPKISLPCDLHRLTFHNSCNGLLCLSSFGHGKDTLYVSNPILGEYISIPPPDNDRGFYGVVLDFAALGYSARTNEYKVLQLGFRTNDRNLYLTRTSRNRSYKTEAMIYTIGRGVWRSIEQDVCPGFMLPFNSSLHGALHWLPLNPCTSIESFDFEREEFRSLPLPSSGVEKDDVVELKIFKDCLFLFVFGGDGRKSDVWVMKKYGVQESWIKIAVIERLSPMVFNGSKDWYKPIMFLSDTELLILMKYDRRFLARYNLETKCLKDTCIVRSRHKWPSFYA